MTLVDGIQVWALTAAMLGAAVGLTGLSMWLRRRGRLLGAMVAAAFGALSVVAAAAAPLVRELDRVVGDARAAAQAQSGSAEGLLQQAQGRHHRHVDAARALAAAAPAGRPIGFAALSDTDFGASPAPGAAEPSAGSGIVYVAVSFSMPPADLRRLARDARAAGAQVVIQGLVRGSFKATAAAARQVFDESSLGGAAIDPNVFRAFGVRAVPTFIAAAAPVEPCARGLDCIPAAPAHERLTGNITLSEALRILGQGQDAGWVAQAAAARLEP